MVLLNMFMIKRNPKSHYGSAQRSFCDVFNERPLQLHNAIFKDVMQGSRSLISILNFHNF
jgi:hypothetical protein